MQRLTLCFYIPFWVLVTLLITGCSSGGTPPVSDRSRVDNSTERQVARTVSPTGNRYRVVAGDTLYSIAWRYQRDFRDLAALNNIGAPFAIYPGQVLKVKGQASRRRAAKRQAAKRQAPKASPAPQPSKPHPLASTRTKPQSGPAISTSAGSGKPPVARPSKPSVATQSSARSQGQPQKVATAPRTGPVKLRWPSSGKRLAVAGTKPAGNGKPRNSIDFALQPGAAIRAAGSGEVVFAQESLAGYRQFVILKHNDTWLSSYGFNAPLQVREGQRVAAGATLATVPRGGGSGVPNERVLRFEVRKDGAAVNPEAVITR